MAVFLFCVFFVAYFYLLVPSRSQQATIVTTAQIQSPQAQITEPGPTCNTAQQAARLLDEEAIQLDEVEGDRHTYSLPAINLDFEEMNVPQLRRECAKRGIRWRDCHGKHKHATRPEMLAQLNLLELMTA